MSNPNVNTNAPRWDDQTFEFDQRFESVRQMLKGRWIFYMPEFLSALGALTRLKPAPLVTMELSGVLGVLDKKFSDADEWNAYKDYWLGEPPEKVLVHPCAGSSALRKGEKIHTNPKYRLHEEYDIPFDAAIRNQGEEGACVAHALAATIEYLSKSPFSDEAALDLYEASRRIDGVCNPDGGALLAPAIQTVQKQGHWPGARVLAPGDLASWKETLSDADGRAPAPIVAGFLVFGSVCGSKASRNSGKWTLPFADEIPIGKHAIAIFGYRNETSAPGGGYFIARNSWGTEYASQSMIGRPGFTLIPYQYVVEYCEDAYAPLTEEKAAFAPFAPKDDFERDYVWQIASGARNARDMDGRLRNAGELVVGRKDEPTRFKAYSPETRREFEANGCAWDAAGRARRFFPAASAAFKAEATRRAAVASSFFNGIEENLQGLVGRESTLGRGLFARPKFEKVERLDRVGEAGSAGLVRALAYSNGLDFRVDPMREAPAEYGAATTCSELRVWRVSDGKRSATVAACFLAPLKFEGEREPRFIPADEAALQTALNVVKGLRGDVGGEFVCAAFGASDDGFSSLTRSTASAELAVATCGEASLGASEDGLAARWTTSSGAVSDERARVFVAALSPRSTSDATQRVRAVAKEIGLLGNVTAERVQGALPDLTSKEIERAFQELVASGEYEGTTTARGARAIQRRSI